MEIKNCSCGCLFSCVQAVAVLHCLQRLSSHPLLAEQVLNAPGALGRLWACLGCGSDHIVAEGARLLVRLFAPAPARHGAPSWRLLRGEGCVHMLAPCRVCSTAMPTGNGEGCMAVLLWLCILPTCERSGLICAPHVC